MSFSTWTGQISGCGLTVMWAYRASVWCWGVSEENERFEVLALEMGDRERADLWESIFRSLADRELDLEAVELGILDGLPGLEAMFKRFFSRAQTQRCQKHAKANACRRVPQKGTRGVFQ